MPTASMTHEKQESLVKNLRSVPIGGIVVSDNPQDVLVAYGVGSCVAICLYDYEARLGGMLHALLPTAPNERARSQPAKFVDQGLPMLINSLQELGGEPSRMVAQLCGGAQVLNAPGFDNQLLSIGERNVRAAEKALDVVGVRRNGRATGGTVGRTVRLYIADGQVTLRGLGQKEQPISEYEETDTVNRQRRTREERDCRGYQYEENNDR